MHVATTRNFRFRSN